MGHHPCHPHPSLDFKHGTWLLVVPILTDISQKELEFSTHLPVEDRKDVSFDTQSRNTFCHTITALKELRCKNSWEIFWSFSLENVSSSTSFFRATYQYGCFSPARVSPVLNEKYDSMTAKGSVAALLEREELTRNVGYLQSIYLFSPWNWSVLTMIKSEKQKKSLKFNSPVRVKWCGFKVLLPENSDSFLSKKKFRNALGCYFNIWSFCC